MRETESGLPERKATGTKTEQASCQLNQETADGKLRQHQHHHQRQMGVLGLALILIGRTKVGAWQRPKDRRRGGVRRVERRRQKFTRRGAGADRQRCRSP